MGSELPAQIKRAAAIGLLGLLLLATATELLLETGAGPSLAFRIAAFTLITAAIALDVWRRILPGWVLAVVVAVPAAWLNIVDVGSMSMIFVVATVAWLAYSRLLPEASLSAGLVLVSVVSYLPDRDIAGMVGVALVGATAFFAVRLVVRQQALVDQLRNTQQLLEVEAAAQERRRIAADIHDVVAHSLAVTLLQLTGARMRLTRAGADAASLAALAEAERIGRESMADLRRVVHLLRANSAEAVTEDPKWLEDLVADYRQAGLPVELHVEGEPASLPPSLTMTLYRICQEALANVVKHAGTVPTSVTLTIHDEVALVVENDVPPTRPQTPDSGLGLDGMRQRADVVGGRLAVGQVGTRWRVAAAFPRDQQVASAPAVA